MQAKVKEYAIKRRKVQKEQEVGFELGLIIIISNFRKLDSNNNLCFLRRAKNISRNNYLSLITYELKTEVTITWLES